MQNSDSYIIESSTILPALRQVLETVSHGSVFMLTDSNVERAVLPSLAPYLQANGVNVIVMEAGEAHKNLDTLSTIWSHLSDLGATRSSLLINLGGGVVTDIGGFAAATFKRGILYINIPTTVLGAVDASVGGKTAIDFNGLKNEIGAFHLPSAVILSPEPLASLSLREKTSGFAEIVKTSSISSKEFYYRSLNADIENPDELFPLITESVRVKEKITREDPTEKGIRKILNYGHTAGHAFETWMMQQGTPVCHGEAVANGILVALILSHLHLGLPSSEINIYNDNILRRYFRPVPVLCKDYPLLLRIMGHDKKNLTSGEIRFVLLKEIGEPITDIVIKPADIETAFDIYRDIV